MVKKIALFVLGLVLLAGSTYGYSLYMDKRRVDTPMVTTIMPSRLLNVGEIIDSSMLRHVSIPVDAHRNDAIVDADTLIGMTVIIPVGSSEEFVSWKLSKQHNVPVDGERYYAFPTDSLTNVSNMVRRGDRVDVWVEFPQSVLVEMEDKLWHLSAVKIIENLHVAHVKSNEGFEITDGSDNTLGLYAGDASLLSSHRNNSNGVPGQNIYIMTDEIYSAYVMGGQAGKIKLSLPDLNSYQMGKGEVTEVYQKLKDSTAFNAGYGEKIVRLGEVNPEHVQGHEVDNASQAELGGAE